MKTLKYLKKRVEMEHFLAETRREILKRPMERSGAPSVERCLICGGELHAEADSLFLTLHYAHSLIVDHVGKMQVLDAGARKSSLKKLSAKKR